jgi:filamentous hemagglutinin
LSGENAEQAFLRGWSGGYRGEGDSSPVAAGLGDLAKSGWERTKWTFENPIGDARRWIGQFGDLVTANNGQTAPTDPNNQLSGFGGNGTPPSTGAVATPPVPIPLMTPAGPVAAMTPPMVIPSNAMLSSGNTGGNEGDTAASKSGDYDNGSGPEGSKNGLKSGGIRITSPNAEMRANANAAGSYVDPLTGQIVATDQRLAADHIVPQNWIRQQPGFDDLTSAQKNLILNDPVNTQGLPQTFNSSKGAQMPGEWQTYKGQALNPGYIQEGATQAGVIRDYITGRISSMKGNK